MARWTVTETVVENVTKYYDVEAGTEREALDRINVSGDVAPTKDCHHGTVEVLSVMAEKAQNVLAHRIHEALHVFLDEIESYIPVDEDADPTYDSGETRSNIHEILAEFAMGVVEYCADAYCEDNEWQVGRIMENGLLDCLEEGR